MRDLLVPMSVPCSFTDLADLAQVFVRSALLVYHRLGGLWFSAYGDAERALDLDSITVVKA